MKLKLNKKYFRNFNNYNNIKKKLNNKKQNLFQVVLFNNNKNKVKIDQIVGQVADSFEI